VQRISYEAVPEARISQACVDLGDGALTGDRQLGQDIHRPARWVGMVRRGRHAGWVFGPFDGLAHESWRHGVLLVCVVSPGRPGGPKAQCITDPPGARASRPRR
jgi:hypothetical protein